MKTIYLLSKGFSLFSINLFLLLQFSGCSAYFYPKERLNTVKMDIINDIDVSVLKEKRKVLKEFVEKNPQDEKAVSEARYLINKYDFVLAIYDRYIVINDDKGIAEAIEHLLKLEIKYLTMFDTDSITKHSSDKKTIYSQYDQANKEDNSSFSKTASHSEKQKEKTESEDCEKELLKIKNLYKEAAYLNGFTALRKSGRRVQKDDKCQRELAAFKKLLEEKLVSQMEEELGRIKKKLNSQAYLPDVRQELENFRKKFSEIISPLDFEAKILELEALITSGTKPITALSGSEQKTALEIKPTPVPTPLANEFQTLSSHCREVSTEADLLLCCMKFREFKNKPEEKAAVVKIAEFENKIVDLRRKAAAKHILNTQKIDKPAEKLEQLKRAYEILLETNKQFPKSLQKTKIDENIKFIKTKIDELSNTSQKKDRKNK